MKKRYLVPGDYMADPSVHVFDGKVYIYPSHDYESGIPEDDWGSHFNMRDYHVFSLDDVMEVVGRALIELVDASMPLAAAPLASLVASTQRNDILHAVAASLRQGV